MLKEKKALSVFLALQRVFSPRLKNPYAILSTQLILKNHKGANHQPSSSLSSMTMNSHISLTLNHLTDLSYNRQQSYHVCRLMVSPTEVDELNSLRIKLIWIVGQSELLVDPISTLRMLTRFLEIHNCPNIETPKLNNQIKLLYYSGRRSLHGQQILIDPVRVQSLDRIVFSVVKKVFVRAEFPSAKRTQKPEPLFKWNRHSF